MDTPLDWTDVMLRSIQGAAVALAMRGVPRERVVDVIDRAYEASAKIARLAIDIGGKIP